MANQDIYTALYNGRHEIRFDNRLHRYYIDGELKQGVTTIMHKVLAKDALMLWPLTVAMRYLSDKVPYITEADLADAKHAHESHRIAGAGTGTLVHEYAEKHLKGEETPDLSEPEYNEDALKAINGFVCWHLRAKPKALEVEGVVYSEANDYAGTFDSILEIDGKTYLCDLKTTNTSREAPQGVYAENFIQLGAYLLAYDEQRQYEEQHGGTSLVQIDDLMVLSCRKDGNVDVVTASDMGLSVADCKELWLKTLQLWRGLAGIKSRLRGAKNG